jgi:hypothetical protein
MECRFYLTTASAEFRRLAAPEGEARCGCEPSLAGGLAAHVGLLPEPTLTASSLPGPDFAVFVFEKTSGH